MNITANKLNIKRTDLYPATVMRSGQIPHYHQTKVHF